MEQLKAQWEQLKEKLKAAWAETQERPWFVSMKERYQELPPAGQTGILYGIASLILLALLATPISSLMDASDQNSRFDEERQMLKELMRLQRDLASQPNVPLPPPPQTMKPQMDAKIAAAGVKPEQIKSSSELPPSTFQGTDEHGIEYKIDHLTLRQAVDLGYELEHVDPGFKLRDVNLLADAQDPHFYSTDFKIVSFSPKLVAEAGTPGKGLVDAITKAKGGLPGGPPPGAPPPGAPPTSGNLPPPPSQPAGKIPALPGPRHGG